MLKINFQRLCDKENEEEFLKQMKLRQAWEINGKEKKTKEMKHEKQKLGVYSDRWNVRW